MPKILMFVAKTDPILRETMPMVKDFKEEALHEIIQDMCFSILPSQLKSLNAAHDSAAGMAANQWGIRKRVFVYTPDGSGEGKRMEIMINPSYIPYLRHNETEPPMAAAYEGCFSIPLTTAVVNRYEAILATYYTPKGKKIEKIMEGWEARVFQHETDHLNGKLMDGIMDNYPGPECLERIEFKDEEEMENFWISKVKASRERNRE